MMGPAGVVDPPAYPVRKGRSTLSYAGVIWFSMMTFRTNWPEIVDKARTSLADQMPTSYEGNPVRVIAVVPVEVDGVGPAVEIQMEPWVKTGF